MAKTKEGYWFIPKTNIGKALLLFWILVVVAISLPLYRVAFYKPELMGFLPEAAAWTYLWYAGNTVILLLTYRYLLKPWANHAEKYMNKTETEKTEEENLESQIGIGGEE